MKTILNILLLSLTLSASAQLGTWNVNVAGISPPRADGAAVALNGQIYAVGGGNYSCVVFGNLQAFDSTNNTWANLQSMPTPRYEFGAAALNGLIYAVGGNPGCGTISGLNVVEAYNPVSNTWSNILAPPTGGYGDAVASANGKLYVIGSAANPNTGYAYDPSGNDWTNVAAFPENNSLCSVAVVNNIIYLIGGVGSAPSSNVYAYDPVANVWTEKASMPTPRYDMSVGVINGIIYVAGGSNPNTGQKVTAVEAYDPQADEWSTNTPLPFPVSGAGGAAINGTMYVIGGYDTNNNVLTNVEAFTVKSSPIVITVPATITAEATGPSGAVVDFTTSATNSTGTVLTTNVPASGSTFPLGTNTVTVTATAGGVSTNATFTVIVQDTTPPVITLLGANPLTNYVNTVFVDPGATATDIVSGNLTSSILVTGAVITNVIGSYTLTYTVSDSSGNIATTNRTVVIETPPPTLSVVSSGSQTAVYWPASATNYLLQMTTNLGSPNWVAVTNAAPIIGVTVTNNLPAAFFRLQEQ
jgi:N-acetylneuraminic acid mutarotase